MRYILVRLQWALAHIISSWPVMLVSSIYALPSPLSLKSILLDVNYAIGVVEVNFLRLCVDSDGGVMKLRVGWALIGGRGICCVPVGDNTLCACNGYFVPQIVWAGVL